MKTYYLYILANRKRGTIYIDITDDLIKSILEFKNNLAERLQKDNVRCLLVYYEKIGLVLNAIKEKKQIEKWDKIWNLILIEKFNPEWKDLYCDLISKDSRAIKVLRIRKEGRTNSIGDMRIKKYYQQRCNILKIKNFRQDCKACQS